MEILLYQVRIIIHISYLETLERNVQHFTSLLSNEKEVLLFPLFPLDSPSHSKCIETGECENAYKMNNRIINRWNILPKTKHDLLLEEKYIKEVKGGHVELMSDLIYRKSLIIHYGKTLKKMK